MTTKRSRNQIPEVQMDMAAAQQAAEQAIQGALRSLAHLTMDDLILNTSEEEVVKGNQRDPGGWVHAPGMLEMFKAADKLLSKAAKQRGLTAGRVTRVRACVIKGTKMVFIWAVADDDLEAIEVKRYESTAWINLITVLTPAKLTLRTNSRHRFAIYTAPDDGPMGACLMFDMGRPLERRKETQPKPDDGTATPATAKKPRATGKKAKNPPPTAAPTAEGTEAKPAADASTPPT